VAPDIDPSMRNADFLSRWFGRDVVEVGHLPVCGISGRVDYPGALVDLATRLSDGSYTKFF
jgi:hypothetical protein